MEYRAPILETDNLNLYKQMNKYQIKWKKSIIKYIFCCASILLVLIELKVVEIIKLRGLFVKVYLMFLLVRIDEILLPWNQLENRFQQLIRVWIIWFGKKIY